MDHFNITVQNGAMVATRRGMQVTKQKHNGLSFVNSSIQTVEAGQNSNVDFSRPLQRRFKFINKQMEPPKPPTKARSRVKTAGPEEPRDQDDKKTPGKRKEARRHSVATTSGLPTSFTVRSGSASSSSTFRSCSSASSAPGRDRYPDGWPFPGAKDSLYEVGPGNVLPSMPTWSTHILPQYLSKENRKLFHTYFVLIPRKMYPFEEILTYNPTRSRDFYYMVIKDMAALHCVLMCGSLFESVAKGAKDSKELAWHISKVCSIVNQKLDSSGKIEPITLECITTLALIGNFIGRYDHWNVHMRGLQQMIELSGGVDSLSPALLSKIRKTDIKGAATLASSPYLPFRRFFAPISDVLPASERAATNASLSHILRACRIDEAVVDSLCSLSRFVQAVGLAKRTPNRRLLYDPNAFTEELHWVQYTLVCRPGPLRDDGGGTLTSSSSENGGGGGGFPPPPLDFSDLNTEDYTANHRICPRGVVPARRYTAAYPTTVPPAATGSGSNSGYAPTFLTASASAPASTSSRGSSTAAGSPRSSTTTAGGGGAAAAGTAAEEAQQPPGPEAPPLEAVLRLAAILYMKELVPDFPRNLGGYSILLALLAFHLREAVDLYVAARDEDGGEVDDDDEELASEEVGSRGSRAGTPPARSYAARYGSWRAMRPCLVWACQVGSLMCVLADINECRYGSDKYDRAAYQRALAQVLGPDAAAVRDEQTMRLETDLLAEAPGAAAGVAAAAAAGQMGTEEELLQHDRHAPKTRVLADVGDLTLCRLFSIKEIRGGKWDDREGLRRIVQGREYS